MEIASAAVVPQSFPETQDIIDTGGGECLDIGKADCETLEVGDDGSHRGLLQHDFAEPDSVGILLLSPRQ